MIIDTIRWIFLCAVDHDELTESWATRSCTDKDVDMYKKQRYLEDLSF